jgi:serine/threonine protein kinase
MELSDAAAWLESLGLAHGDIRPPNLLLDGEDYLKLADFDCFAEIGTPADGSAPPWARVLGPEAGSEDGTFGVYRARTEQFAIGSVLYYMTRGYEPYEDEDFGQGKGLIVVGRQRCMVFP